MSRAALAPPPPLLWLPEPTNSAQSHNGPAFSMDHHPSKLAMGKGKKRTRSPRSASASSTGCAAAAAFGLPSGKRVRRFKEAAPMPKCDLDDVVMGVVAESGAASPGPASPQLHLRLGGPMLPHADRHAPPACGRSDEPAATTTAATVAGPLVPISAASTSASSSSSAAAAAEPQAVIGAGCAMLVSFSRDRDCLFALLNSHLNLADMARLSATCRTWRQWIVRPSAPLLQASRRTRVVSPHGLRLLAQCEWARPMMIQIRVNMRPEVAAPPSTAAAQAGAGAAATGANQAQPAAAAASSAATALVPSAPSTSSSSASASALASAPSITAPSAAATATLASVVADLARFPRLSRLGLQLASHDADREDWRAAFDQLPNLQYIELLMAGPAAGQAVLPPPPMQQFQFPPPMPMAAQAPAAAGGANVQLQIQAAGAPIPAPAGGNHAVAFQMQAAAAVHAAHLAHMQAQAATHAAALVHPVGSAVAALFQEVHRLPRLESLSVHNLREPPSSLDFGRLPLLPRLRSLSVALQPVAMQAPQANGAGAGAGSVLVHQRLFRCSPTQAEALGRCRWIQQLRCGVWAPPPPPLPAPPALALGADPDEAAAADSAAAAAAAASLASRTLGALANGKRRALSEWREQREAAVRGLTSSKDLDSLPLPSALPLQTLCLSGSVITAAAWRYLSRLTHLTELAPAAWAADLNDAPQSDIAGHSTASRSSRSVDSPDQSGWSLLANFRHLRALRIAPVVGEEYGPRPLRACSILPPLLRGCRGLQSLHLHGVDLSRAQLQQLIRGLPDLRHLSLRALRLEDAAPLAEAKRLQALSLHFCVLQPDAQAGGDQPEAVGAEQDKGSSLFAPSAAIAASPTATPTTPDPPRDFRRALPAMPALTQLLLHDRVRMMAAAAAPLNAALLARTLRLRAKHFHQNLLAEPVQISGTGASGGGGGGEAAGASVSMAD